MTSPDYSRSTDRFLPLLLKNKLHLRALADSQYYSKIELEILLIALPLFSLSLVTYHISQQVSNFAGWIKNETAICKLCITECILYSKILIVRTYY